MKNTETAIKEIKKQPDHAGTGTYRIRAIHGYHGGTRIRDCIGIITCLSVTRPPSLHQSGNGGSLLGEDKYDRQKSKKPDKMCNLHKTFARPLKVLATLGNRVFASVETVKLSVRRGWVKAVNMSNPAMISSVKDGSFYSYEDTTVGRIFDRGLDNCEWNTYMGANRRILVQAKGEVDGYELDTVFELDMDMSFEVSSMRMNGELCSNQQINSIIKYLYEYRN